MRGWNNAQNLRYQIPSETRHFAKLKMAIATNTPDEAVWLRQRPEWVADLLLMHEAMAPETPGGGEILVPEWAKQKPKD